MVTSFVLLSEEKISKKEKEKVKESQKNNDSAKIEKKERGKSKTISKGAHRERHLGCACVCRFPPCS